MFYIYFNFCSTAFVQASQQQKQACLLQPKPLP
jgi:hypothetical protein